MKYQIPGCIFSLKNVIVTEAVRIVAFSKPVDSAAGFSSGGTIAASGGRPQPAPSPEKGGEPSSNEESRTYFPETWLWNLNVTE